MPGAFLSSCASSPQLVWRVVDLGAGAQGCSRVVGGSCVELVYGIVMGLFGTRVLFAISCGPAGGRLGSMCCPGSLSLGMCTASFRARSGSAIPCVLGGVASQVGNPLLLPFTMSVVGFYYCSSSSESRGSFESIHMLMASESSDPRPGCGSFCDDGDDVDEVGELDVTSSGLSHAGADHNSSVPDSAAACSTPRHFKFHLQIGRHIIDCVMQEHRLMVAKGPEASQTNWCGVFLGGGHWRRNSPYQCP